MSSLEGEAPKSSATLALPLKYEYKGRFGAAPMASKPMEEASHEEIDAFVKNILGLTKRKEE